MLQYLKTEKLFVQAVKASSLQEGNSARDVKFQ